MAEAFIGEIRMFGFQFAPVGWALCTGQTMPISQNQALFSLLGTTYGGNGTSNFQLPDLQGRVPVGQGTGPGLSPRVMGESDGTENVTLSVPQLPGHSHAVAASDSPATSGRPAGAVPARTTADTYGASPDGTVMNAGMIGQTGNSAPHPNMQPFLTINCSICLVGIFPSRN